MNDSGYLEIVGERIWLGEWDVRDIILSDFPWRHDLAEKQEWIIYGIGFQVGAPLAPRTTATLQLGRRVHWHRNIAGMSIPSFTFKSPGWIDLRVLPCERVQIDVAPRPEALVVTLNTLQKRFG